MMDGHKLLQLAVLTLVGMAACGGGDFSNEFSVEIERDCRELLNCTSQSRPAKPSDMQECVKQVGDMVGAAPVTVQQEFIDTVARCQDMSGCYFVGCAKTSINSYSVMHRPQIQYVCEQTVACQIATGKPSSPTATTNCVAEQSGQLDADMAKQAAFEQRFLRCNGQLGCAYGACQ